MDKDKMLDYFNDREATLFRDELGSNARYHELLREAAVRNIGQWTEV